MTTYFIQMPDGNGERQDLDMLLNALEKRYEIITVNVVGVIADDARVDALLRDLAMDLGQGRKAIFEKTKEAKAPTIPKNGKEEGQPPAAPVHKPKIKQAVNLDPRNCLQCNNEFQPRRRNQVCCSTACGKKYHQRKWLLEHRAGDGIKHGSLAKH